MGKKIKLTNDQKKQLIKKCFDITKTISFTGKNNQLSIVSVSGVGDFKLKNETIRKLSTAYISKYASAEEKNSYNRHLKELKDNYEEYLHITHDDNYINNYSKKEQQRIAKYARKYCTFTLNMTDGQLKRHFHKKGKYVYIMDDLMKLNKQEDIINYFDSIFNGSRMAITDLRTNIAHYISVYNTDLSKEEKNKLEYVLRQKINIYSNYLISKRLEKEEEIKHEKAIEILPIIKNMVDELSKSDITLKEYLSIHNITIGKYNYYMKVLRTYDEEFNRDFDLQKEIRNDKNYLKHNSLIEELLNKLVTGIKNEDGKLRAFNILDYYLTYNVDLEELSCSIESKRSNLKKEDYLVLRKFISHHKEDKPLDIKETLETNTEINAKRDNNGFPIPKTGRIITREEKEDIIIYLNENNVPLTIRTYNIALNNYIEKTNYLNKTSNKVLKK